MKKKEAIALELLGVLVRHQLSNREAHEVLGFCANLADETKVTSNFGQTVTF